MEVTSVKDLAKMNSLHIMVYWLTNTIGSSTRMYYEKVFMMEQIP